MLFRSEVPAPSPESTDAPPTEAEPAAQPERPKNYKRMYDSLNELILFGGNSCNNAHSLLVKIVNDLDIPTLKLQYPTTQKEIIELMHKTNAFLKDFKSNSEINTDLTDNNQKCSLHEVKKILNNNTF